MSIQTVQRRRHPGLRDAGGRGVPQDRVQAYKWLELAVPRLAPIPARDAWIEMRAQIGATLSAEGIAEARRLARAWTPKVR